METKGAGRSLAWLLATWVVTRAVLLLFVFGVYAFSDLDVTSDVSVIYRGWYEVLRQGTFPLDDVTWQYPPAAALAILSPAALPFLSYAHAFFLLAFLADVAVMALLVYPGRRPDRSLRGAWVWVAGVPLLGPTVYARYDVMVTAVAVAALVAGVRHPRVMGALTALGALLKVWPALLLVGCFRRRAWVSAAVTASGIAALFAVSMPGAFAFLTFQRDRGTEVESLGALVFHVARHFGWQGQVLLNYGSVEFLGPHVNLVSTAALALTGAAFGWLLLWRLRAARRAPHTLAEAAFTAVLMFTVTSRVISPQYLVWLVGLAAVCVSYRASRMGAPALMVVAAAFATVLEFPFGFAHVVTSDRYGVLLLAVRNGLLVAASLTAARRLWRSTVPPAPAAPLPQPSRRRKAPVSP
ncbi:glycosyltransferase family 87 protein [Streptomyces roseochromogenus]|uniref:Membrane protein n=1 Tax=Streptomyces roseochromogenus subsp. oscitans DS 12.976 TaxID=1352936 RepID=V6JTX4_STRRC|nr:glycosyltransferase family 87 protein [Streptomyces roseochromogenus]EST23360.1 membrane protein [Streptomyces roseochromogenus subsp. oscitans DS 12.976]